MQTQVLKTLNTFYKTKNIFLSIVKNNNILAR